MNNTYTVKGYHYYFENITQNDYWVVFSDKNKKMKRKVREDKKGKYVVFNRVRHYKKNMELKGE